MGLPAMYASIYDDVATEPPYVPTCGECRWCTEVQGAWDGGLCLARFEGSGMYSDLRTVDYDQCACEHFEEE